MKERPTPETDAVVKNDCSGSGYIHNLVKLTEKLERERDEARKQLSRIYYWVKARSQDGFIDSQTHEQNIDRCYNDLYDRLESVDRDRKALKTQLKAWEDELSKVMPSDFKDWWQNSNSEWPLVARWMIENLRSQIYESNKYISLLEDSMDSAGLKLARDKA